MAAWPTSSPSPTRGTRGSPTTCSFATSSSARTSSRRTGSSSPKARRSSGGPSRRAVGRGRSCWRSVGSTGLADVLDAAAGVPCFVVSEALAEEVTGFHVHRGALASMHRPPLRRVEEVVGSASRLVVLEDVVDHTNVGAIIRCAAALGIDGVLLSPRCADPLYRRAVKVSMGAVFSLPWTRLPDWYDALPQLSRAGFTTLALTPDAGRRRPRCGRPGPVRSPAGARRRIGGTRVVEPLAGRRRRPGSHPDVGRGRLAQRGVGDRGRVLRPSPEE